MAIARAVAKRPDVLLCDEPTGALDIATGIVVLQAIEEVNRELGTTTAVITHNALSGMADRVVSLSDGRIASERWNEHRLRAADIGDGFARTDQEPLAGRQPLERLGFAPVPLANLNQLANGAVLFDLVAGPGGVRVTAPR